MSLRSAFHSIISYSSLTTNPSLSTTLLVASSTSDLANFIFSISLLASISFMSSSIESIYSKLRSTFLNTSGISAFKVSMNSSSSVTVVFPSISSPQSWIFLRDSYAAFNRSLKETAFLLISTIALSISLRMSLVFKSLTNASSSFSFSLYN